MKDADNRNFSIVFGKKFYRFSFGDQNTVKLNFHIFHLKTEAETIYSIGVANLRVLPL